MRMRNPLIIGSLALAAALAGCGAGGGSAPAGAGVNGPAGPPGSPSGVIIAASGPLTILGSGSVLGSTIMPQSPAAIFIIDSGTAPKAIDSGGALGAYALTVGDVAGVNLTPSARAAMSLGSRHTAHDPDVRVPDIPSGELLRSQLLDLQHRSGTALRSAAGERRALAFAVGDDHTFALAGGTINGSAPAKPILMPATLVAQSAHANVWLDDAVYTNPALFALEYPSGTADFRTVANDFENDFTIETQAFGRAYTTDIVDFAECDASGNSLAAEQPRPDTTGTSDPHINIVITDQLKGSGEGGYFYGLDLLNQAEANCVRGVNKPTVNGLPMLVIESDAYAPQTGDAAHTFPANNETYWLQGDMPQTVAHEFQHYLHFVNKYLQQHVDDPNNPNAGTLDDSYIDEGCSVLAQDLVAPSAIGRESPVFVRAFLLEPDDFSLTSFSGYQPNALDTTGNAPYGYYRNTVGNYGYAYLFVRYLYDRFGPAAIKAIYAETNPGGAREPDTGPASAAAGGESFSQLFREFTAALAVHSGGSVPEISTDPAYRFDASIILRGATQTYSRRLAPYNVRTIVQPGPLNPQTFANNRPTGYVSLAPGTSLGLTLLDGGALFLTPVISSGTTATIWARVPLAGGGSLGQGPMPTPTPAYY